MFTNIVARCPTRVGIGVKLDLEEMKVLFLDHLSANLMLQSIPLIALVILFAGVGHCSQWTMLWETTKRRCYHTLGWAASQQR